MNEKIPTNVENLKPDILIGMQKMIDNLESDILRTQNNVVDKEQTSWKVIFKSKINMVSSAITLLEMHGRLDKVKATVLNDRIKTLPKSLHEDVGVHYDLPESEKTKLIENLREIWEKVVNSVK